MTEHKTDMNITKIDKYKKKKKTEQHFYCGILLKHWAVLLQRDTKQNTTTIWWIKQ